MSSKAYPGYGEVLHFRRLAALGGAEFLRARFGRFDFGRHAHDRVSFGLITEGALQIGLPGGSLVAGKGDLILFHHDLVHWGGTVNGAGWAIRTLYADPAVVAELAREAGRRGRGTLDFRETVVHAPSDAHRLLALHRAVESEASALETECRLLDTLDSLLGRHALLQGTAPRSGREPRAVRRARDYLEARVGEDVGLDELSAVAGLSPSRLVRTFKAAMGLPPHAYHGYLRVRRAQALLRAGHPVAAVAQDCGFADQSHLTRAFKRHVGLTPGRFRRA